MTDSSGSDSDSDSDSFIVTKSKSTIIPSTRSKRGRDDRLITGDVPALESVNGYSSSSSFASHQRTKRPKHNSHSESSSNNPKSSHNNSEHSDSDDSDSEWESARAIVPDEYTTRRDRKKAYASQRAINRKKIHHSPPEITVFESFNKMKLNDHEKNTVALICKMKESIITFPLNPDPDYLYLWFKKVCPTNWQLVFTGITTGSNQELINVDTIPRKQWGGWKNRGAKVKLLLKHQITFGTPVALVLSPSAYTSLDFIRSLRKLSPKKFPDNWKRLKIAKLFGKNMKRSEQKEYCRTRKFRLAVGTPERVSKLLSGKKPPLQFKSLKYLFLDMTPDKLGMTILDDREIDFYVKKIILKFLSPRILSGDCKIILVRENRSDNIPKIHPIGSKKSSQNDAVSNSSESDGDDVDIEKEDDDTVETDQSTKPTVEPESDSDSDLYSSDSDSDSEKEDDDPKPIQSEVLKKQVSDSESDSDLSSD